MQDWFSMEQENNSQENYSTRNTRLKNCYLKLIVNLHTGVLYSIRYCKLKNTEHEWDNV